MAINTSVQSRAIVPRPTNIIKEPKVSRKNFAGRPRAAAWRKMGATHKLIIKPGHTEKNYWRDLFHYRELFLILACRDVPVRYKQSVAGAGWALLHPLMSLVIMSFIFGKIAGLPSQGGAPYPIMVCAGLLPWLFFSNALTLASQSVVNN